MRFSDILAEQAGLHPSMQPQDYIKLCYQAVFGPGHLLRNPEAAENYFYREWAETPEDSAEPLFEIISPAFARLNLGAWKAAKLPPAWLFALFRETAEAASGSEEAFRACLAEVRLPGFASDLEAYWSLGLHAVHHSDIYRAAESPAYRVVRRDMTALLPLFREIASRRVPDRPLIIALDGRSASGKSTLAALLGRVLPAGVIHMDDFFLPAELRTEERFAMPGGNVHFERIFRDVLPGLKARGAFSYRCFDCSAMAPGAEREIPAGDFRVVEGAYSLHPVFGGFADVKVFLDIDPELQRRRVTERNGEAMAAIYAARWIPLEERYFDYYGIREKADLRLRAEDLALPLSAET